MGDGSRVRALNAKGEVLTDRTQRLCTYEGYLRQGGWVRAVIRSPTSATVHFLHNVSVVHGSAERFVGVDGLSRMSNAMWPRCLAQNTCSPTHMYVGRVVHAHTNHLGLCRFPLATLLVLRLEKQQN